MNVVRPTNIGFLDWAAALVADNGLQLSPPLAESEWKEWAARMSDEVDAPAIPSPQTFEKWDDWAQASLPQLEEA
jgi:hypothetical protein